jgi:hypothetical protein
MCVRYSLKNATHLSAVAASKRSPGAAVVSGS